MSGKWYRLADPDGSFHDPQTGLLVGRGQAAEVRPPIGALTAAKIAGKGLIECDPPSSAGVPAGGNQSPEGSADPGDRSDGADTVSPSPDELMNVAQEIIDRRIEALKGEPMSILRDMAKELGVKAGVTTSKAKLATAIAVAEWQREHGAGSE